jgi:hypothetical protein
MGNGRFEAGLEIRRKVLGAEYVDRALAQPTILPGPSRST